MPKVPGITGRSEQTGLRRRHQAEFRTGALAEDRNAGIEKALRQRAVMIGNEILQDRRARRRARALQEIEILQEERHAGERTLGKAPLDLALGIVVVLDHDRVNLRIDLCRASSSNSRAVTCFFRTSSARPTAS